LQRQKVPDGAATAKAIDYSLNRWAALTRYLDDGDLPADNNWIENQIRPIAIGRSNWLFAGSLRAGKRAAAVMSLLHSARLNGHDPYAYLKDVLERLPTQPASRVEELLPQLAGSHRRKLIELTVVKTGSPDVHGRPQFAKLSIRDDSSGEIAPVHSDFRCETNSLSLMGSAGRCLDRLHALWVPRPARAVLTTV
jgi:hypothetical protein